MKSKRSRPILDMTAKEKRELTEVENFLNEHNIPRRSILTIDKDCTFIALGSSDYEVKLTKGMTVMLTDLKARYVLLYVGNFIYVKVPVGKFTEFFKERCNPVITKTVVSTVQETIVV